MSQVSELPFGTKTVFYWLFKKINKQNELTFKQSKGKFHSNPVKI